MKKILLVVGLAFAVMTASAQLYVGGAMGFKTEGAGKDSDGNKWGESISIGGFLPEVGYSLSDKMDVGVVLGFVSMSETDWANDNKTGSTRVNSFGIEPYMRYTFCEFGKFSVLGRTGLGANFGVGKNFDGDGNQVGKDANVIGLGFTMTPVVLYKLSDKICLFTNLNFAGLNFNHTIVMYDGEKQGSQSNFGIGMNYNNVFNLGNIQVGFVYTF